MCDFIMIGRGVLYNPFLIREISGQAPPSKEELKKFMLVHIDELLAEYGEHKAVRHFRKYFSGVPIVPYLSPSVSFPANTN